MIDFASLARDALVRFAVKNLPDNRDLYLWLASGADYDFLKEKIPDFERKYLQELRKEINLVTKKSP